MGKAALSTDAKVREWLESLAGELVERVSMDRHANNRIPTSLTAHVRCGYGASAIAHSKAIQPNILGEITARGEKNDDDVNDDEKCISKKIADSAFDGLMTVLKVENRTKWSVPQMLSTF